LGLEVIKNEIRQKGLELSSTYGDGQELTQGFLLKEDLYPKKKTKKKQTK
jgi:hypothetical protein